MQYRPTIGLEVHAELKTRTKMFCDSPNDPEEKKPNVNVCPICMGHPGTLPTLNKGAVKHILKLGIAVGGELADYTEFDRKNYFYPDLPKGYQISQYEYPLVKRGMLNGIQLTRIHLEEDTARSLHEEADYSLVDFNRAGIPLMELVTEPAVKSAKEASSFARELQLLLRSLEAGEANMEKGQMRVEANISVSANETLGTKVEIKNLNSFRSVERAIEFEITRQSKLLEGGGKVVQETRGWDEKRGETYSQRLKEESHDYRYFPEPDLPKLRISEIPEFSSSVLKKEIAALPWELRKRYLDLGLKAEDAEVFVESGMLRELFESTIKDVVEEETIKRSANYITSDLIGLMRASGGQTIGNITPLHFRALMELLQEEKLSSRGAKILLTEMYSNGGNPRDLAPLHNLIIITETAALEPIVEEVIKTHHEAVEDYQKGKEASLKFLLGKAILKTKGSGDPKVLEKLLKEKTLKTK